MNLLIWQARTSKNISLIELSKLTGISKSALSNYENGKRYPNMLQMEIIAKALNIKLNDLFQSEYK